MTDKVNVLVEDVKAAVSEIQDTQAALDAKVEEAIGASAKESKAAIEKAETLAEKIEDVSAELTDIHQKMADGFAKGEEIPETLGAALINSSDYTRFVNGEIGKLTVKANTTVGDTNDTLVQRQRLPGIIPGPFRSLRVRDVLPVGTTTSNAIEYTREATFVNAAAETAEAATKPETDITFELVNTPVRTIAHWLKLSKQVMDDAPALQSHVDTRLRYGVELREDNQLLNGDGTGANLSGITDAGNHTAFTPGAGFNELDAINEAIYTSIAADYNPTAIIMNPADWGKIERTKVGTSDERYVVGQPQTTLGPMLWGLPVVVTNNMTEGQFAVGAFDISHQIFDRMGTVVEMFEEDATNVQQNLVTVRAEKRVALATYLPAAVQYGATTGA
ncbi:MAG: phage major capsid protein [Cyanobacteria bacterium P01_A01_bin.17]